MTYPTAQVSLWLIDGTDHVRVESDADTDNAVVYLAGNLYVGATDPTVMEGLARAFQDAADELHAKAGVTSVDPEVAKTLAIATGGAA